MGNRTLTTAFKIASKETQGNTVVVMADLDFASGHVFVHTGVGTITFNGGDYVGIGTFGSVSSVDEESQLSALGINMTLSGIDPTFISTTLNEDYRHRAAKLYLGLLTGGKLIIDPILVFSGLMDTMNIALGSSAQVTVRAESRLADWDRPRITRYTNETQQEKFPGDLGLEFVSQMVEREIPWGAEAAAIKPFKQVPRL